MLHAAWPTTLFAGFTLFAVTGCDTAYDATSKPDAVISKGADDQERTISNQERLGRLKYERDKLVRSVQRLERDREETTERLRSLGIFSASDLNKHPDAKLDAQELTRVVEQIHRLSSVISDYESAIHRVEIVVRRQERETQWVHSAPSDAEFDRLSVAFHEVEEELHPQGEIQLVEDLQMEQVLDAELGRHQNTFSNSEK
tara:strand:+ start:492 stop:1094 length:603 start_codon:yes stop_codon:yes gene_type:complete